VTYEIDLLYYVKLFKKWGKIALPACCIAMILAAFLLRLTPVSYVSTLTFLGGRPQRLPSTIGRMLGITEGSPVTQSIDALLQSQRMHNDIRKEFDLDKKPEFTYSISLSEKRSANAILVRGADPDLVKEIATFVGKNLDKINEELDITTVKPMIKVLDPANRGVPQPREIGRKVITSGLLTLLLILGYGFFNDYLKMLSSRQPHENKGV